MCNYKNDFNLDDIYDTTNRYNKLIDKYIIASSSDIKGNITSASEAFCKISKYTKEELIGKPHSILRDTTIDKSVFKELWNTISNGNTWQGEISNIAKDGTTYWVEATISPNYDNKNNLVGYTSIRQDITDKKKFEKYMMTDHLTGVSNRKYFDKILTEKIEEVKQTNNYITLAIFDIDSFKRYNDTYGHNKGDIALQSLSKYVQSCLKEDEYFFRIGGEEFAIVYTNQDSDSSFEKLNKIVQGIETLNIEHKGNIGVSSYLTISCGAICTKGNNIHQNTNLFVGADMLLYNAKEQGKNKVIIIES